ncbi:MAG: acyl-CoA dehydrogenase [Bacteroidetes bacterium QH_2_64_26]|nr:MAG: acyl-CoA dehydrogenase [Bacteroidetes bacterium QH_2_64_26]
MADPVPTDTTAATPVSDTWRPEAFDAPDYYDLDDLLPDEARTVRDQVRAFVTDEVVPIIEEHAQRAEFPRHLIPAFAKHGLLGPTLPSEYGGGGKSNIAYGLMMQELERGDSGLRSFCSVTGSLVMYPIWRYGTEAQKEHWLPALANGEAIGCFGLTEPDVGSNPSALQTRARRDGDAWVLNGHKRWSTNATIADVAVIWAKDENDTIRGFLVETDREGVSTPPIDNTWSLRAAITSEVVLDDVRVSEAHRLPAAEGLGAPLSCLTQARYGICWGTIGAAMACYDAARQHAQNREQFGQPIGGFQLMQERLVEMVQEITKAQLLNWRLGTLKDAGDMRPQQVSLAKRNNCETALEVARSARQVLGGNGVTSMYPVMRHMNNLESVITYEGTHEVHTLVVGEDVTGENAFT